MMPDPTDLHRWWNALTAWTAAHPSTTTLILLPIVGAVLNVVFKARTTEELARMPRTVAWCLVTLRTIFPDPGPILAAVAGVLLRQHIEPPPGIESMPPPPMPRNSLPPPADGFGGRPEDVVIRDDDPTLPGAS